MLVALVLLEECLNAIMAAGWTGLTELLRSFDIANFLAIIIGAAPALALLALAYWLEKRKS